MFCALTKLAFNAPKDGRGIGQKQVLEQNLSSTDVHGRTSVERYTDVQQLKMVQMVSQSQFFRDLYLLCLMRLPFRWKNVRNFKSTYPDASVGVLNPRTNKISHRRKQPLKIFIMRLPCMVIREFS